MKLFGKWADGLVNVVANLGTNKDKRTHSRFQFVPIDHNDLDAMYATNWLAANIVDVPADDMTRNWRTFAAPSLDINQIDQLKTAENKIGIRRKFNQVTKWSRLYGGGVILLGVEGTGEPNEPLDLNQVKKGSLKFLHVFDRHDVSIEDMNMWDPSKPNYRMPEYYRVSGSSHAATPIHHTRVLRFDGPLLPWRKRGMTNYWGLSLLGRTVDVILNNQVVQDAIATMVFEAKLDVIQVPELFNRLSTPSGEEQVLKRFRVADMMKSINNTLLLDKEEDFVRNQTTFSGLEKIPKVFLTVAAGASRMPVTKLLGTSSQGLNDTGEGDLSNYYDMINAQQVDLYNDPLQYFDEIFTRSELGRIPDGWQSTWEQLWQMSATEQADVDLKNSQRDKNHTEAGHVPISVVTEQLHNDGTYDAIGIELIEDIREIEELEADAGPVEGEPDPGDDFDGALADVGADDGL